MLAMFAVVTFNWVLDRSRYFSSSLASKPVTCITVAPGASELHDGIQGECAKIRFVSFADTFFDPFTGIRAPNPCRQPPSSPYKAQERSEARADTKAKYGNSSRSRPILGNM